MPHLLLSWYALLVLLDQSLSQENCLAETRGAIITQTDVALKNHTRKTLHSVSYIQCSLRCLQQEWCISINFKRSKKEGIGMCQLNDYGVSSMDFSAKLGKRKGFLYSQLRPAEVRVHTLSIYECD